MPCDKRRYPSERVARREARKLTENGDPIRAYPCPDCSGWHVTKQPASAPERPKDALKGRRSAWKAKTPEELEAIARKIRGDAGAAT